MSPSRKQPRGRVLVVDDDSLLLEATVAILGDRFEVVTAESGRDAIELLWRERFDVVVSDQQMPGMTGWELFEYMQIEGIEAGTVLTTGARDFVRQVLMNNSAKAKLVTTIILKPFDGDQLVEAIERAAAFARMKNMVAGSSRAGRRKD